jgi:hypothetical protein
MASEKINLITKIQLVIENDFLRVHQSLNITVVIEAWMSKNIDLLYRSVGKEKDEMAEDYDPINNLKALHEFYPECCVYLSMLNFKLDWREILPL